MKTTAHLIYFSPTGTTRKTCAAVARGLGAQQVTEHDLTLPGTRPAAQLTEGVAIVGCPVYAGRVPELCLQRLEDFKAQNVPTVLLALYGNRAFEDALVELRDVAAAKGFRVVAAGAFIGEHSYSTAEHPIAAGRPDAGDLQLAVQFGQQVAAKLARGGLDMPAIPGNKPYREGMKLGGVAPETDIERCTLCGRCAAVCPPGVITVSDTVVTRAAGCLMCCACLRACGAGARLFQQPLIEEKRSLLQKNCSSPKAPETFL